MSDLDYIYYNGMGIEQNYKKAAEWCEKAAEQGDRVAKCNLGVMYYHGKGVEQNYEKVAEWCEKSAEQGDNSAQYNLGEAYYEGKGVEKNYPKAVEWWKKAAENGITEAQNRIAETRYKNPDEISPSEIKFSDSILNETTEIKKSGSPKKIAERLRPDHAPTIGQYTLKINTEKTDKDTSLPDHP